MSSDNQFTALGPAIIGFQTNSASIDVGADIFGNQAGIKGHCNFGTGVEGISSAGTEANPNDNGVGVFGRGPAAGVRGIGDRSGEGESRSFTTGTGVDGFSESGVGVKGHSNVNTGV